MPPAMPVYPKLPLFLSNDMVVFKSCKFSWVEPFSPKMRTLDKLNCCLKADRIHWHPKGTNSSIQRVVTLFSKINKLGCGLN